VPSRTTPPTVALAALLLAAASTAVRRDPTSPRSLASRGGPLVIGEVEAGDAGSLTEDPGARLAGGRGRS